MIAAKAVMDSLLKYAADVEPLAVLSRFRVCAPADLRVALDQIHGRPAAH